MQFDNMPSSVDSIVQFDNMPSSVDSNVQFDNMLSSVDSIVQLTIGHLQKIAMCNLTICYLQ